METKTLKSDVYNSYIDAMRITFQKVSADVYQREKFKKETFQWKDFHFLSANLANFLPCVDKKEYADIYHRLLINIQLSSNNFDYISFDSLNYINLRGNTDFLEPEAKKKAKIFCTYHLGGYRAILGYLMKSGFPLALVIDKKTYNIQKEVIEELANKVNTVNNNTVKLKILMAESPEIGKNMAMALLGGYSILIFLDGNTGVGGTYERTDKQLKINFLNQEIYSRSGVATLSYATKTSIIPIISYYENDIPYYEALDPINPKDEGLPPKEFIQKTTSHLYAILEKYLIKYYVQWESWFYFHRFLNIEALKNINIDHPQEKITSESVQFNTDDFGLFKVYRDNCLFNKKNYSISIINDAQFDVLALLEENNMPYSLQKLSETMEIKYIKNFLKMGVLGETKSNEN